MRPSASAAASTRPRAPTAVTRSGAVHEKIGVPFAPSATTRRSAA